MIPESDNPEDDKIFLFFKENAMDGEHTGKATIARIGQLCKVTTHTCPPPKEKKKTQFAQKPWKDRLFQICMVLQKQLHVNSNALGL